MMRSTIERVTFRHAFALRGLDERQPPGTYEVETDEEPLEGLSFLAYRRVATAIRIPMAGRGAGVQPDLPDRPTRPGGGTSARFSGGDRRMRIAQIAPLVRGRPAAAVRRHRADRGPSHRRPGRARPRRHPVRQRRGANAGEAGGGARSGHPPRSGAAQVGSRRAPVDAARGAPSPARVRHPPLPCRPDPLPVLRRSRRRAP